MKEIKMFGDKEYNQKYQEMVKKSREKNGMTDELMEIIVERINKGITQHEIELLGIPDNLKEKFIKLYKNSTK